MWIITEFAGKNFPVKRLKKSNFSNNLLTKQLKTTETFYLNIIDPLERVRHCLPFRVCTSNLGRESSRIKNIAFRILHRLQRGISPPPSPMTKHPLHISPSWRAWFQLPPPLPHDWWPTHLNSHLQNFTPLPHFLKYCWRYCSNVFKTNKKLLNKMYVARWVYRYLLFLVFCILKSHSRLGITTKFKWINLLLFPHEIIEKPYTFWWFQLE